MGRRSRKRREPGAPPRGARSAAPAPPTARDAKPGDTLRRGYARSEERNEQVRQSLEPLAPGERPGAVTAAAIAAALFGLTNLGLWAAGVEVRGERPKLGGTAVFAALMFVAAAGMWRAKYWAVLGFQALLALIMLVAFLALLVVDSVVEGIAIAAILLLGGWLFWKLVRAMARLQMPVR